MMRGYKWMRVAKIVILHPFVARGIIQNTIMDIYDISGGVQLCIESFLSV